MQPNPMNSVPSEVAVLAPNLYLLEMAILGILVLGVAVVGLMLRYSAKRDKDWMSFLESGRAASQAMAAVCHAQQEESRRATTAVAERMGENGAVIREVTGALEKNTAALNRVHLVLDKNGSAGRTH